MTRPPEQPGEDAAGILRAIGSLLVALSNNVDNPEIDRTVNEVLGREERRSPVSDPTPRRRTESASSSEREYIPSPEVVREVDFILSDARERARQILDDSMERAESLIRPDLRSVPGIDPRAFEDLRQATRGLATEIRDVQRRLSRIEALLRASSAARVRMEAGLPLGDPDDDYPSRERTFAAPPVEDEPPPPTRPEGTRSFVAPEPRPAPAVPAPEPPARPPVPPPPVEEIPTPLADFEDDDEMFAAPPEGTISPRGRDGGTLETPPVDLPASAIPHIRTSAPPEPEPEPRSEGEWLDQFRPEAARTPAPAPAPHHTGLESNLTTLHPDDGAIILRLSPVSGFQGLMRVHDAILRLAAVSQATVEAYSQGEARLRVELTEEVDPEELVSELGRTLQEPASISHALPERRELFVTLQ